MESLILVSLIALWVVVLVTLGLTLRIVRWTRSFGELDRERSSRPELEVGKPAPDFRAQTLAGEPASLSNYIGRPTVFIFVSPNCGACREALPTLVRLAPAAKARAGVEMVLVSDLGAAKTGPWLDISAEAQNLAISLPVLVAPPSTSKFIDTYDPRGYHPYYCLIDERGIVQSRGSLGHGEWQSIKQSWEDAPAMRLVRRYR